MIGQPSSRKIPVRAGRWKQRWQAPAVCLVLAAITFAVFGQTLHHQFIDYDDNAYVYENPVVAKGLTLKGAVWALTYEKIGHWHPLTWLTHMADCQVYGLKPGGHHLTNVLLHTATVIVLFLVLRQMTGAFWRSAFVAAVFAIHPLRVESVAWIAERKDVLSGVFFMLTLWAYVRYARQPSRGRYVAVAVWYGLGLLCKNTLVTLPFVLLLLDWWPLQRVRPGVVKEKIPLFLLAVGSCVATFLAPENMLGSERVPFLERIGNAVISYGIYLWQMVYPAGLAVPYLNPPNGQPFWMVALALAVLAAISTSAWVCRKGRPYLLVGWLWYLGMLVPTIGIVQISYYAHADRYTYLPGIGLALAGTWAVGDWSAGWKHRRAVLGGLMAAVIGALMVCAWLQTAYWQDSETLWNHTLACTTGNYMAHYGLGLDLVEKGSLDEAITQYQEALQINPGFAKAHNNLGLALFKEGRVDEAITQYQNALQLEPNNSEARNNLGFAVLNKGRVDEAITQFQQALAINPNDATLHFNLGVVLHQKGKEDEAIAQYQKALEINPDFAEAHYNLGGILLQMGRVDEAITHFEKAVQIRPGYAEAHSDLGIALFKKGKMDDAIAHFQIVLHLKPGDAEAQLNLDNAVYQKALQLKPDNAETHYNVGNDLRQKGRVNEAIAQYQDAVKINPDYADALVNLGSALLQTGKVDEAIAPLQKALQINPRNAKAHNNLGNAFLQKGNMAEAIAHFQQAVQIEPTDPWIKNNLAWLLATCAEASLRDGNKAVELATQADDLVGGENPIILHTLAAALAESGRFSKAVETAQHALGLAQAQSNTKLSVALQSEIELYQAGSPFHSPASTH